MDGLYRGNDAVRVVAVQHHTNEQYKESGRDAETQRDGVVIAAKPENRIHLAKEAARAALTRPSFGRAPGNVGFSYPLLCCSVCERRYHRINLSRGNIA